MGEDGFVPDIVSYNSLMKVQSRALGPDGSGEWGDELTPTNHRFFP